MMNPSAPIQFKRSSSEHEYTKKCAKLKPTYQIYPHVQDSKTSPQQHSVRPIQPILSTQYTRPTLSIPIEHFPPPQPTNDECIKKLHKLFKPQIDFRLFINQILGQETDLNNYALKSYLTLKSPRFRLVLPHNILTPDKVEHAMINAGKLVYQAITRLYVARFLQKYPQLNQRIYLSSLHTIALGIAIKCSWDERTFNTELLEFLPKIKIKKDKKMKCVQIDIDRYNEMEVEFLKAIDWNTSTRELSIDS